MRGDKLRLNGQTWTVHRVHAATDTLSLYRWHDVVAKQVTCTEVLRFHGLHGND